MTPVAQKIIQCTESEIDDKASYWFMNERWFVHHILQVNSDWYFIVFYKY